MAIVDRDDIGGGGGGASFSASFNGTPSDLDQYNESWQTSSKTKFVGEGLNGITLNYLGTQKDALVTKVKIYVDGKAWRTITFAGGSSGGSTCNFIPLLTQTNYDSLYLYGWRKKSVAMGLYGRTNYATQQGITSDVYEYSDSQLNSEPTISTSGLKGITLEVYYALKTGSSYHGGNLSDSDVSVANVFVGFVTVKAPYCSSISISGGKREFYAGDAFNYSTLTVSGHFKYEVAGTNAYDAAVENYSISDPSDDFEAAKQASSTQSTITVSYLSKTATYTITIYGVLSYTMPQIKSARDDGRFRQGESSYTIADSTVTYGDETTASRAVTVVSGFDPSATPGVRTVNYQMYDAKTKTTHTWQGTYTVYGLSKISLDATDVEKNFNVDDDYSFADLVVTAVYGQNGEAGSRSVSLDDAGLTVAFPEKEVGPDKTVTVSYSDGYSEVSETYDININGLYAMDVDISAYGDSLRVMQNGTLAYGEAVVKVRRYQNGVLSNWTSSEVPPVSVGGLDVSAVGDTTATFSVTEDGVTLSYEVPVTVFSIDSLSVSNYSTEPMYYEDDSYPTVDLSALRVIANTSDGMQIQLSYNAVSDGYEVLIDDVLQTEDEITISEPTVLVIRPKARPGVTRNITITAIEKAAKADEPLVVSGDAQFVSVGEAIDKSQFSVYQVMNDGTTVQITDFDCVISGKTGLKFDSSDAQGQYYDLVFSKAPSASAVLEDAAFLDGIESVSNVNCKSVYDIGTAFDTSSVTCTVNYYHAQSKTSQQFRAGTDVCQQADTAFTANEAGEVSVSMTLYGQTVSKTVYVRKVTGLTKVAVGTATYGGYKIHEALNPSGHGYKFQKTYDAAINGVDTYDVPQSALSFAFTGAGSGCSATDLIPTTSTSEITVVASYSENGFSVSASGYKIYVRRIKSASLIDENANAVSKIHVDKGNNLDLTPYRMHVEFNDGTVTNLNLGNASAANPANGTIIVDKITAATVSYTFVQGDSINATYTIHVHYVSAVTTNLNSIVGYTYYVGDVLDLSSVTASRTVSSTDSEEAGYPATEAFTPSFVLNSMNIGTSYQLVTPTNYTLSFTDSGIQKSASFVVLSVTLSSISANESEAFKDFDSYVEGQRLDLTGLTITKTYNNGNTDTLQYNDPNVQIVDGSDHAIQKTAELSLLDDDVELYAKVTENGVSKYASIGTLSVAANELDSIEIMSTSTQRTAFTYGDRFSVDGLIVKANFTNGTSENVNLASLVFSGVAIGHQFNPTDDSVFGDVTISLFYTHGGITKTTSYAIEIKKPVLASISTNASSDAVVTQFKDGDVYSEAGLAITGVFANGWTYAIPNSGWHTDATTVLNVDQQTGKIGMTGNYGAKRITVYASNPFDSQQAGVTGTYSVDVLTSGAIVSAVIRFDANSNYDNYTVGETFDARGVYFHITDIDGIETDVSTFVTSPAIGTVLRSAQRLEVTCTYVNGSFTRTATYKVLVSVPNLISFTETKDYKLAAGYMDGRRFVTLTHEEQTIKFGKTYDSSNNVTGEYYPLFHEDKVQVDDNPAHADTFGYNVYTGVDAEGDCIGYMDLGVTAPDGTVVRQAHVILFDDPLNPIDGQGNIEVTFPHYVQGLAERVNKCRFGIVYNNRLFVSGNPEYKSCDWHSGAVNVSQSDDYDRNADLDFTYFSDLDYCYYGTDDTAIVGYDIYRDGDLLTVKEGSKHQATLYRRSYKLIAAQSYDGTEMDGSLAEEAFPMFDINANGGVGGLSNRSILSFVGETLVLTKQGMKAITNKENVYNSSKYSVDVSSYINPRITSEGLENAFAFAFDEKLLLKTDRGVYVGYHELRNEEGEYEWYYVCDLDADLFFEYDGELYFANDEGGVYRFPKDNAVYLDRERSYIGEGGAFLTVDEGNDKIIASNAYADEIQEGRAFHLLTTFNVAGEDVRTQIHASLGKFVNSNYRKNMIETGGVYSDVDYNGYIDPSESVLTILKRNADGTEDYDGTLAIQDLYYDGRKVKFDLISANGQNGPEPYVEYTLSKVGGNSYSILDPDGQPVALEGVSYMRMCFAIDETAVTYIQDVEPYGDDGAKSFSLLGDHSQTLDLVYYNNQNGYYSGVVTAENKVKSFYVTAPYSMGSISTYKTIWAWFVANDTNLASHIDVGYVSSRKQGTFETSPGTRKFSFKDFDFGNISFLNDSLPHVYSRYRTLPSVNFIRFLFKNEGDSNMALTNLEVIYTLNGLSKGAQ